MSNTCLNCIHFDPHDTSLPVCNLHRRFMSDEWTCGDFDGGDDGPAIEADGEAE